MTVLVTGGAGFIGSHTVRSLLEAGRDVVVIDDLSTGDAGSLPSQVELIRGDFADPVVLESAFARARIDACIHFAAKKDAAESVHLPALYYSENTGKSIDLLRFLQSRGVEKFVFSSTAAVYGNPIALPIDEGHPTVPVNPYGWSKLFFERVLTDVGAATEMRSVSLRYFNAAGADIGSELGNAASDRKDLISVLMEMATQGRPFTINGSDWGTVDGTPVRDLVHVNDLADAHVLSLDYLDRGEGPAIINLGSEQGFSVRQVVEETKRRSGLELAVLEGTRRPGDVAASVASAALAHDLLGWRPRYSDLSTIVRTAWDWEKIRQEAGTSGVR